MVERLALPEWDTPATSLDAWVEALQAAGLPVTVERESTGVSWLEIGRLLTRGYVVMQGRDTEAINFEFGGSDPDRAIEAIEAIAASLGWGLHDEPDDPEDEVD